MNNQRILELTLNVIEECNIKYFPINCKKILTNYNLQTVKYSSLPHYKIEACLKLSTDAITINNIIYYNDSHVTPRINFSLMHELGHIILQTDKEREANFFASNILAPRMAVYYAHCKNYQDIVKTFKVSKQAAKYILHDYYTWWNRIIKRKNKMNLYERNFYNHFYNSKYDRFIYAKHNCHLCGTAIINSQDIHCESCSASLSPQETNSTTPDFLRAEYDYLYNI